MELAEFFVTHVQWALPTWLIRLMVRTMLRLVGWQMRRADAVVRQIRCDRHMRRTAPVTTDTDKANEQHYGNDPRFFEAHLGPCLKYSACEWPDGTKDLAEAEVATLHIYQERARLSDLPAGSRVLELGCGWGSLTLANATRFPDLHFTAFSNSPQQIEFIRSRADERGLTNVTLHVEDYADFVHPDRSKVAPEGTKPFDGAVAIETIEHAQNIAELLGAVAERLRPVRPSTARHAPPTCARSLRSVRRAGRGALRAVSSPPDVLVLDGLDLVDGSQLLQRRLDTRAELVLPSHAAHPLPL